LPWTEINSLKAAKPSTENQKPKTGWGSVISRGGGFNRGSCHLT